MDKTQIELLGHRALVADHCELCDHVAELTARVEQLEWLMSEAIFGGLDMPEDLRDVVAEMGPHPQNAE